MVRDYLKLGVIVAKFVGDPEDRIAVGNVLPIVRLKARFPTMEKVVADTSERMKNG